MIVDRPDPPEADDSSDGAQPPGGDTAADPLQMLASHIAALISYAEHFAAAKVDGVRLGFRRTLLFAAVVICAAPAMIAMVVGAWWYVLRGTAGGFSAALGGRAWLGDLIAGGLGLGVIAASVALVMIRRESKLRRETMLKYEERKIRQRCRYGRDVDQAALEAA